MNNRAAARLLGGEPVGRHDVLCPGPTHSSGDRSLHVTLVGNGFRVHSYAGDPWDECRDYVRQRLGLARDIPARSEPVVRPARPPEPNLDDAERTRRALALWDAARDPRGTLVERYLSSRGLKLPDEAAGEAIRFHPDCPFGGERHGCMIALVRNIINNESQAIHRTALDHNGRKAMIDGKSRAALGPIAGGAIKLSPYATGDLAVAEGVETALSIKAIPRFADAPAWALISAGGLARLPVLRGVERLIIAIDHDPAGVAASEQITARWLASGRAVVTLRSTEPRADLNNEISNGY